MKNLIQRSITGALFVGVIIASLMIGSVPFAIVFGIATILTLNEFYSIIKHSNVKSQSLFGVIGGGLLFLLTYFVESNVLPSKTMYGVIPIIFLVLIFELYRNEESPIKNIAYTLLGIVYIAIPFSLMNNIVYLSGEYSYTYLLSYFILVWSSDTFAYLSGISMGRHKLFERISPKKTWEGSVGGAIATALIAFFFIAPKTDIASYHWIVLSFMITLFGTYGDLIESMFKRSLGIKDSGNILPGHGGFLDRFDAVIFALPAFFAYLHIIN